MIIIKEYYSKGKKIDTKYQNTEFPDKEFNSMADAQKTTRTIRIDLD